jgi:signal transduction histidine kinase
MSRGSLRLRLLVAGALSILVALALAAFGLMLLFERHVERRVAGELAVHLDQITAGLDRTASGQLVLTRPPADPRFETPLSGLYWQVGVGDERLRSRSLWDETLALPPDTLADGAVHEHRIAGPGGTVLLALERSVILPARLGGGALRAAVAVDAADITAATRAFAVDLLPYLAVLALVLIASAAVQVTVGLRPLGAVRSRLAGIRAGTERRLGDAFPDEIRPLAAEVDALIEAREAQIERARARAADLAHGLKTPLQVLSGDVARLRGRGEAAIADDIEQVATAMRRHVDRELARARLAAGGGDATSDVAAVVDRVLAVIVRTPAGAALRWTTAIPAGAAARIDPDDLAEAIGNLVENAARHAARRVGVNAGVDGDDLLLEVVDDGAGIASAEIGTVLARGGRLDLGGDGAGLGLAIVRDIAEAWGGRLTLASTPAGTVATLTLRRTRPAVMPGEGAPP